MLLNCIVANIRFTLADIIGFDKILETPPSLMQINGLQNALKVDVIEIQQN